MFSQEAQIAKLRESLSRSDRKPLGLNIEPTVANFDTWLALAKERGFDEADFPFEIDDKRGKNLFEEFRKLGEAVQKFMSNNSAKVAWGANMAGDFAFASTMIMAGLQEGQYARVLSPMVSQVLNILPMMFPEAKEEPQGGNILARMLRSYNPARTGGIRTYLLGNAISCAAYTVYTIDFAMKHHDPLQATQALIGLLIFSGVIRDMFGDKEKVNLPPAPEAGLSGNKIVDFFTRNDIPVQTKVKYLYQTIFSKEGTLVGVYGVETLKLIEGLNKSDSSGLMLMANAVIGSFLATLRNYVFKDVQNQKKETAQEAQTLSSGKALNSLNLATSSAPGGIEMK